MLQIALNTLCLALPALIPSWRFFKSVQPSPRIEWRCPDLSPNWQAFRPRPAHISGVTLIHRMFWNPRWNEALYMVTCAERLTAEETRHSIEEVLSRLRQDCPAMAEVLQFRLKFIDRVNGDLQEEITFISDTYPAKLMDPGNGV